MRLKNNGNKTSIYCNPDLLTKKKSKIPTSCL